MNNLIQILIGSVPVLIAAIIILIWKKKKIVPIICIGLQLVFAVCMILLYKESASVPISNLDAVDIYKVYSAIAEGKVNSAHNMLNDRVSFTGDKMECALAKARLYAAEGNWDDAILMYRKVLKVDDSLLKKEEKSFFESIEKGDIFTAQALSYNVTNAKYLKSQGLNPEEYGFKEMSQDSINENVDALDDFQNVVIMDIIDETREKLEDEYEILGDIDTINDLSDLVMSYDYKTYKGTPIDNSSNDMFEENEDDEDDGFDDYNDDDYKDDDYLDDSNDDLDDIFSDEVDINNNSEAKKYFKKIYKVLKEYKDKYPDLFREDQYLEAYIICTVRAGYDLDELLEDMDADVMQKIIDMYLSGIVGEGDFSEDFTAEYQEMYDAVMDRLNEIQDELSEEDGYKKMKVDGMKVSDAIDLIEENDDFAFAKLTDEYENQVEAGAIESGDLASAYLTLSIVEKEKGNSEKSVEYFNDAVKNGKNSSEVAIAVIMNTVEETYVEGVQDLNYIDISNEVAEAYKEQNHYEIISDEMEDSIKSTTGTAVSQTIAMITIGRIDTSKFPELTASVVYSGDESLDKMSLSMKDCGINITDYSIEKVKYSGSKVVLLCDVSGSMANSFDALKAAVKKYVENMEDDENVCIVTFDTDIEASSGFTTDKQTLIDFAENELHQQGGTMVGKSTNEVLDMFANGEIANTLIVMTDGEDNIPYSDEQIKNDLGLKAEKNNVAVYTIGLGESLVPEYLEKIAQACAGKFIYCSDESALVSAYEFIHKRTNSEYKITFEAEDLDSNSRRYELEVLDDNATTHPRDYKDYKLLADEEEDDSSVDFDVVLPEGVTITGLDVNQLAKSDTAQMVNILGSGFDKVNVQNVYLKSIKGESNCKIKSKEDGKITFQVAPSVAADTYSVYVKINDTKYKVDQLVIGTANPNEVVFGAYRFKADNVIFSTEKTILSGNVNMNDYLYFYGDVELQGNINKDAKVKLVTGRGAYVKHDTESYSKFDKFILPNRSTTYAFERMSVEIFDDANHYNDLEEYETELPLEGEISTLNLGIISMEGNHTRIYPNRVQVHSGLGILKDNTITDLLTNGVDFFKIEDGMPYIKGEIDADARLMKEGPFTYFNMDIEAGVEDEDNEMGLKIADFVSIEAKASIKVMFDTYKREFTLGYGFSLNDETPTPGGNSNSSYSKCSGDAGITISVKGEEGNERYGDKFLDIEVALPLEFTFYVEGVPVTLKDIKAEMHDYNITEALNNLLSGSAFSNALKSYITNKEGATLKVSGAIDLVSTAALPENAQAAIKKWLGDDVSLVSLDDLYGEAGINFPYLGAGATLKVLGCIQVAQMEMELGAISYRDYIGTLLNADDGEKHYGFSFQSKKGIEFDWDLVGADVGGVVSATITVDRFLVAAYARGSVGASTNINIFGNSIDLDGEAKAEAAVGVWKDGKWRAHASIVASVEGKASIKLFGHNFLEKKVKEQCVVVDADM